LQVNDSATNNVTSTVSCPHDSESHLAHCHAPEIYFCVC